MCTYVYTIRMQNIIYNIGLRVHGSAGFGLYLTAKGFGIKGCIGFHSACFYIGHGHFDVNDLKPKA